MNTLKRLIRVTMAMSLCLQLAGTAHAAKIPDYISTAVASSERPEEDRSRDVLRLPAEVLAFAGVKPGDKVADFMPGRGYFTKIFCRIVGEGGHVYAIAVPRATNPTPPRTAETLAPGCSNVTAITLESKKVAAPETYDRSSDPGAVYEYWTSLSPAETFAAPEPLDVIWTSENYRDLYNPYFGSPRIKLVNNALFKALKPGGRLLIEDHAAKKGSGAADTDTLHRIDKEEVKKSIVAAGFKYEGESRVLHHPEDDHTQKAHDMHDKTDRFLLKFRRPK